MDKPREKFIDFTLGPNWKENLPEHFRYQKPYPNTPRELGQHLSYDPDIPTFAEGGIASFKEKMKNPTLTKNMKHVKWKAIPPLKGPNPEGLRKEVKQDTKKPESLNGRYR